MRAAAIDQRCSSGGQAALDVHGGAGLGEEVLDDHLLDVAVAGVAGRDRPKGGEAVGPGLADADEDAGREGDLEAPGRLQGRKAPGGRLVGRDAVAGQVGPRDSSIMPWLTATLRSWASSSAIERPGVRVGEQARSRP